MKKFIALSLLAFFPVLCNAQDLNATQLQCEGTYTNYTAPDMRDLPVNSIYIEISGDHLKVLGAPGFDSTYSVINRLENGSVYNLIPISHTADSLIGLAGSYR